MPLIRVPVLSFPNGRGPTRVGGGSSTVIRWGKQEFKNMLKVVGGVLLFVCFLFQWTTENVNMY